ncbi:hypothetical protein ACIRBX_06900 [Kitasatospora sp. NPDC096147]|uniref:hypothetical protein n=1 Tax=Kitasatospora sp. NPDC096147 TaxID=3364093 RepID=UPI003817CDD9
MGTEFFTVARGVRSLHWDGEGLLDPVAGGRRWSVDGTERPAGVPHGPLFDRAVVSPSGRYRVLYAERGTEGLVLQDGLPVREFDRSSYQATEFDHPVAVGRLPDGREVLAHCPEHRGDLRLVDLATGEQLTPGERDGNGLFHSRPSFTPDGRYLLSHACVWGPYGLVQVYDTAAAPAEPVLLGGPGVLPFGMGDVAEVVAACWLDDDRLVLATGPDSTGDDGEGELGTEQLGVWSMAQGRWLHRSPLVAPPGLLLPRGGQLVSLHGHPRLLDAATGALIAEWPEVVVPAKDRPFEDSRPTPTAALSPDGGRLAVAVGGGIALVDLPAEA